MSPISCTDPVATTAYLPPRLTTPIVAFEISTPRASGLRSPFARLSGPSPKKTVMFVPAKVSAGVVSPVTGSWVNAMSPWISITFAMFSARLLSETAKTLPSASPKRIAMSRPSSCTTWSTAPPVVLMRSSTCAPPATGPSATSTLPLT